MRVEQALTLCRPNRTGDIMTIGGNRLVLFLSFCRINDLDTALNHIFPIAYWRHFSQTVWSGLKMIKSVPSWCRCACLPQNNGACRCL
ncbi:BcsE family c-di-GMP-binding protein [Escherichia coli]